MSTTLTQLSHLSLLELQGPEARKFLQGQATCNVELVSETLTTPGGLCNPQGRLYGSFLLGCGESDQLLLRMREDITASTVSTLGKYIVFSKAGLKHSVRYRVAGLSGFGSRELLASVCRAPPASRYASARIDSDTVVQLDEPGNRFECWIDTENPGSRLADALEACPAGDLAAWIACDIADGEAQIQAATQDIFIPQMLNFQATGHISFTKGCYTGQEVVARMHYKGKTKRRAYAAYITDTQKDEDLAGQLLYVDGNKQGIGTVVNSVQTADGNISVLAVITIALAESGRVHLGSVEGPALSLNELPYELPS